MTVPVRPSTKTREATPADICFTHESGLEAVEFAAANLIPFDEDD